MEVAFLCLFVAAISFGLGLQLVVIAICNDTFQQKYGAVLAFSCAVIGLLNFIALFYGYAISRHASRPPIGRFGRFTIDAISVCIALFLGEFVKDGFNLLTLMVTPTLYFHSLAKVLHIAPDIGVVDLLLELFLQVMVYETSQMSKDFYSIVAVLVFCVIVILLRCWLYAPPTKPVNEAKKVDGDNEDDGVC